MLVLLGTLYTQPGGVIALLLLLLPVGSPNRVAALGENVVLLVNLAWSAVLYIRFLRGHGSFTGLER
jgi:hypothetical protein